MSEEALQIGEKTREVKSKGEKERYTHLNAEFQRIARIEKKAFLSEECKEAEETIEWEGLENSKEIGEIKGTLHVRMGTIKDRNGKDQTEAEEIKKF